MSRNAGPKDNQGRSQARLLCYPKSRKILTDISAITIYNNHDPFEYDKTLYQGVLLHVFLILIKT